MNKITSTQARKLDEGIATATRDLRKQFDVLQSFPSGGDSDTVDLLLAQFNAQAGYYNALLSASLGGRSALKEFIGDTIVMCGQVVPSVSLGYVLSSDALVEITINGEQRNTTVTELLDEFDLNINGHILSKEDFQDADILARILVPGTETEFTFQGVVSEIDDIVVDDVNDLCYLVTTGLPVRAVDGTPLDVESVTDAINEASTAARAYASVLELVSNGVTDTQSLIQRITTLYGTTSASVRSLISTLSSQEAKVSVTQIVNSIIYNTRGASSLNPNEDLSYPKLPGSNYIGTTFFGVVRAIWDGVSDIANSFGEAVRGTWDKVAYMYALAKGAIADEWLSGKDLSTYKVALNDDNSVLYNECYEATEKFTWARAELNEDGSSTDMQLWGGKGPDALYRARWIGLHYGSFSAANKQLAKLMFPRGSLSLKYPHSTAMFAARGLSSSEAVNLANQGIQNNVKVDIATFLRPNINVPYIQETNDFANRDFNVQMTTAQDVYAGRLPYYSEIITHTGKTEDYNRFWLYTINAGINQLFETLYAGTRKDDRTHRLLNVRVRHNPEIVTVSYMDYQGQQASYDWVPDRSMVNTRMNPVSGDHTDPAWIEFQKTFPTDSAQYMIIRTLGYLLYFRTYVIRDIHDGVPAASPSSQLANWLAASAYKWITGESTATSSPSDVTLRLLYQSTLVNTELVRGSVDLGAALWVPSVRGDSRFLASSNISTPTISGRINPNFRYEGPSVSGIATYTTLNVVIGATIAITAVTLAATCIVGPMLNTQLAGVSGSMTTLQNSPDFLTSKAKQKSWKALSRKRNLLTLVKNVCTGGIRNIAVFGKVATAFRNIYENVVDADILNVEEITPSEMSVDALSDDEKLSLIIRLIKGV
jgi:hypothetical protein